MKPLTDKQKRVLLFIEEQVACHNYPPSVREIGKALGINSTATVHAYLDILNEKGYIKRQPSKPRAIKLLRGATGLPEQKCFFAPLIGRITAGAPILAEENLEGYFPVPHHLSVDEDCFVLQVSGDSMVNAGIRDQDYVFIRQQKNADNGEIVAVLIGDEATVKRIYFEKDGLRLQPENEAFAPLFVRQAEILGKVIGLFRRL